MPGSNTSVAPLPPMQWRLAKRAGQRFLHGHPWIFAGEFSHKLKGTLAGQLIQVVDDRGEFLATGYGNPHSLIAFRQLQRSRLDEISFGWLMDRFLRALAYREQLGVLDRSHRLIFAEADGLPGLVVDVYRSEGKLVFVLEVNTAGAERLFLPLWPAVYAALTEHYHKLSRQPSLSLAFAYVIHRASGFRKLEGLEILESEVSNPHHLDLTHFLIFGPLENRFDVDLLSGQKTGFFLDQADNLLAFQRCLDRLAIKKHLRVLDLFCYLGQWSQAALQWARQNNTGLQLDLVDVSSQALSRALSGLKGSYDKLNVTTHSLDLMQSLEASQFQNNHFDVVICDPPAFVKNSKMLPQAERAYLKINRWAAAKVKREGLLVSCSCSGLIGSDAFLQLLNQSFARETFKQWHWGGQAADHPIVSGFPEGKYLKSWMGIKSHS